KKQFQAHKMCMKTGNVLHLSIGGWVRLITIMMVAACLRADATTEEAFDSLQVGSVVDSNVTVTTKTKAYTFILPSTGMTNLRVADLPTDVQHKLGFLTAEEEAAKKSTGAWAKKTIAKLEAPQVQGMEKQLEKVWHEKVMPSGLPLPRLT